ncbi:MAG: M15 family metallopeptidase [Phycisphaerae bacterium]
MNSTPLRLVRTALFGSIVCTTAGCIFFNPALPSTNPQRGGTEDPSCAPVDFAAPNFIGTVRADPLFLPALERLQQYAAANQVKILITNSFRDNNAGLHDAIVPPANRSNHLVGHAIDFNLRYGVNFGTPCDSTCMSAPFDSLPAPVRGFLAAVRADGELKWGGDFTTGRDVVHIDDRLNRRDPTSYDRRYRALRGNDPMCQVPIDDPRADLPF